MNRIQTDIASIVNAIKIVTKADPLSTDRYRANVDARFILFKICRELLHLTFMKIGNLVGKDHATVLYGCRKFDDLIVTDREFRDNYEAVVVLMNDIDLQSKIDDPEFLADYITIKSKYEDLKSQHKKTQQEYLAKMFCNVSNSAIKNILEDSGCSMELNQTLTKVLATKQIYN